MRADTENTHLQNKIFFKEIVWRESISAVLQLFSECYRHQNKEGGCHLGLRGMFRNLPSFTLTPGQGEREGSPRPPNTFQMFILRTQWALWAILLNKLIATLHQADFFLLKRVDYYYRGTMGYYLWSKPQNKPSFHTRSKQKAFLAIVGRQQRSPRALEYRPKDRAQAWRAGPSFQEAAQLGNSSLLFGSDQCSPVGSPARKASL